MKINKGIWVDLLLSGGSWRAYGRRGRDRGVGGGGKRELAFQSTICHVCAIKQECIVALHTCVTLFTEVGSIISRNGTYGREYSQSFTFRTTLSGCAPALTATHNYEEFQTRPFPQQQQKRKWITADTNHMNQLGSKPPMVTRRLQRTIPTIPYSLSPPPFFLYVDVIERSERNLSGSP